MQFNEDDSLSIDGERFCFGDFYDKLTDLFLDIEQFKGGKECDKN